MKKIIAVFMSLTMLVSIVAAMSLNASAKVDAVIVDFTKVSIENEYAEGFDKTTTTAKVIGGLTKFDSVVADVKGTGVAGAKFVTDSQAHGASETAFGLQGIKIAFAEGEELDMTKYPVIAFRTYTTAATAAKDGNYGLWSWIEVQSADAHSGESPYPAVVNDGNYTKVRPITADQWCTEVYDFTKFVSGDEAFLDEYISEGYQTLRADLDFTKITSVDATIPLGWRDVNDGGEAYVEWVGFFKTVEDARAYVLGAEDDTDTGANTDAGTGEGSNSNTSDAVALVTLGLISASTVAVVAAKKKSKNNK